MIVFSVFLGFSGLNFWKETLVFLAIFLYWLQQEKREAGDEVTAYSCYNSNETKTKLFPRHSTTLNPAVNGLQNMIYSSTF